MSERTSFPMFAMHVRKGLCDYLTYAATYAACRVEPRIKLAFNASHDNGLCWCCGCCCCCDTIVLSGDHPFECEFCGSCFRDDGTLRGHKRIHTGEKPYECNGCGKRFSLKHQLETHYRVHTGKSARSKKVLQVDPGKSPTIACIIGTPKLSY